MWYKKLHNQIFIGILLGILLGIVFPTVAVKISFIGDLFVSALKMIIAPLILTSIFIGISGIGDIRKLGSLGKQTILYYLSTTFIAVLIGVLVVNIINPGKDTTIDIKITHSQVAIKLLSENDLNLSSLIDNPKAQTIIFETIQKEAQYKKKINYQKLIQSLKEVGLIEKEIKIINYIDAQKVIARLSARGFEITNDDVKRTISAVKTKKTLGSAFLGLANQMLTNPFKALSEGNAIGIIFFALLFGAFATMIGEPGKIVIRFMEGANTIVFKIVDLIIKTAPIGVFSLIATLVGENAASPEKLSLLAQNVGFYMLTVIIGILIHALIILPTLLYVFGKMSPIKFFLGMRSALLTAFSTCTSGGTLPLTFKATQVNLKLSKRVTDFVLPLGATVNMDGTALYEAVAVIFIANFLGIDLTFVDQIIIFLTASIAAVGAATIPSAGLITMTIVLSAVGLPTSGIAIIMAVDRFLDMFRTAVNVEGDAVGSAIISKLQEKNSSLNPNTH